MNEGELRRLLRSFSAGEMEESELVERLRSLPFEDLGFAKPDHHRALRQGFPEVILGLGKTAEQIIAILERLHDHGRDTLLITRLEAEVSKSIQGRFPDLKYHALAKAATLGPPVPPKTSSLIAVVSAGTSDVPIAEEAALTAEVMGNHVERVFDVGVAGLHRLLSHRQILQKARVIVVVAGMEGALPSVVGGLVGVPVIAVPTSIGYGSSLNGLAALLGMLNSCASNVTVVNIDNGFGAGFVASLINQTREAVITSQAAKSHEE